MNMRFPASRRMVSVSKRIGSSRKSVSVCRLCRCGGPGPGGTAGPSPPFDCPAEAEKEGCLPHLQPSSLSASGGLGLSQLSEVSALRMAVHSCKAERVECSHPFLGLVCVTSNTPRVAYQTCGQVKKNVRDFHYAPMLRKRLLICRCPQNQRSCVIHRRFLYALEEAFGLRGALASGGDVPDGDRAAAPVTVGSEVLADRGDHAACPGMPGVGS